MTSSAIFSRIRRTKGVYVDKTKEIYENILGKSSVILVRPRRFGKSLICSTLASLFGGTNSKYLFDGLWISKDGRWDFDAEARPVLHLNLTRVTSESVSCFRKGLIEMVNEASRPDGITLSENMSPGDALLQAIKKLYDTSDEKGVVLVVDEYDKPLLKNLDGDSGHLESIREILMNFYDVIKDHPKLHLVFFTGLFRFSEMSIFSTLNSFKDISFSREAGAIAGFTETQVREAFPFRLNQLAELKGIDVDEVIRIMQKSFNGYVFGYDMSGKLSDPVYCSFAVCCALDELNLDNDYWYGSGSDADLVRKMTDSSLISLDSIVVKTSDLIKSCPPSSLSVGLLMYYGGYLTIEHYSNGEITLGLPNQAVARQLTISIANAFKVNRDQSEMQGLFVQLADSFLSQPPAAATILDLMRTILSHFSYDLFKTEGSYRLVIDAALLLRFQSGEVVLEKHTNEGRIGTVIEKDQFVVIIEYKRNAGNADDGISQIARKHYCESYLRQNKVIYAISVNCKRSLVSDVAVYSVDSTSGILKEVSSASFSE